MQVKFLKTINILIKKRFYINLKEKLVILCWSFSAIHGSQGLLYKGVRGKGGERGDGYSIFFFHNWGRKRHNATQVSWSPWGYMKNITLDIRYIVVSDPEYSANKWINEFSRVNGNSWKKNWQNWEKVGRHKRVHHGFFDSSNAHFMSKY